MKNMIDFYNFIPEYYNDESRDFQIFTRVFDSIENSLKFDIDTINTILDTDIINNNYINSIGEKVGFFNTKLYSDDILRFILSAFPYILKYKGSLEGIRRCVQAFLKINGIKNEPIIEINNDEYLIRIGIESNIFDFSLLNIMLKYIIPTGYFIDIYFFVGKDVPPSKYDMYTVHDIYIKDTEGKTITDKLVILRNTEIEDNTGDNISGGRNDFYDTVGLTYATNEIPTDNQGEN
jgi:hypothetical protein